jgi:hypothetical protein
VLASQDRFVRCSGLDELVALLVMDHLAPYEARLERDGRLASAVAVDLALRVIADLALRRPGERGSEQSALGAVLYQLLTGRWPLAGPTNLEPIRMLAPDVPPELSAAVHKALAREPHAQFSSLTAFGAAIGRFSSRAAAFTETLRSTDPAPPPEAEELIARSVLVRSALLGTIAGLALATLAIAGVVVLSDLPRIVPTREAPALVHVELDVAPREAEIALDGIVRGIGHFSSDLLRDHRQHRFRISLPGYETVEIPFQDQPPAKEIALFRSVLPSKTGTQAAR